MEEASPGLQEEALNPGAWAYSVFPRTLCPNLGCRKLGESRSGSGLGWGAGGWGSFSGSVPALYDLECVFSPSCASP